MKRDLVDLRARFDNFAKNFGEKAEPSTPHAAVPPAFKEAYWQSFQDLFTRDVTQKGLLEMVRHDASETFRFFARDLDTEMLKRLPWWKRFVVAEWKLFQAMAYRLSPARRILFAVGVPILWVGWLRYLFTFHWMFPPVNDWEGLLLIAGTLILGLLLLELRDKLSLKGDLEVARQIQFGLVPSEPCRKGGWSIHAAMRPANTVGGDYYDVIELGDDALAIAVADVAGKGMPAALLMAMLQGSLRTLITAGFRGAELVSTLNAHLYVNIPTNRLVTFFYGELAAGGNTLRYLNAGHNAPLLLGRNGDLRRLDSNGMALGIVADAAFEAAEVTLDPGDRLFLYTDGITEAFNLREEEYGEERLIAFLSKSRDLDHPQLIEGVKADVLAFCGPVRPHDDMTLMVLAREA